MEQRALRVQDVRWQREARQAELVQQQQQLLAQQEALRERARRIRTELDSSRAQPQFAKYELNQASARQVKEDSRRFAAEMHQVDEQIRVQKSRQVSLRKEQCRQAAEKKLAEAQRQEGWRQEMNVKRYSELREDLQRLENAVAAAEREELDAVSRLQNSQSVRADVSARLQTQVLNGSRSPRASPRGLSSLHHSRTGRGLDASGHGRAGPHLHQAQGARQAGWDNNLGQIVEDEEGGASPAVRSREEGPQ